MQTVSDAVKTAVNSLSAIKLTSASFSDAVVSAIYTASANGGDAFSLGNACAASLELVINGEHTDLRGTGITVNWSLTASGSTEYPLITGTVTTASCAAGQTTLTINDAMYVAGGSGYVASDTVKSVSCTPYQVYQDLCDQLGVSEDSATAAALQALTETFSSGISAYWTDGEKSVSECCGELALLIGADAYVSRENSLVFKAPTSVDFSANTYAGGGEVSEAYSVNYIVLQTPSDSEGVSDTYTSPTGSTGTGVLLESPFASQDMADRVYAAVSGLSWRYGSFSIPGGLLVEPGDIVTATTEDFTGQPVHASTMTMTIDGGVMTAITSAGVNDSDYGSVGSVNTALTALTADLVQANQLIAEKASIADVAIYKDSSGAAVINYDGVLRFDTGKLSINSAGLTLDAAGNAVFKGELEAASGTFKSYEVNETASATYGKPIYIENAEYPKHITTMTKGGATSSTDATFTFTADQAAAILAADNVTFNSYYTDESMLTIVANSYGFVYWSKEFSISDYFEMKIENVSNDWILKEQSDGTYLLQGFYFDEYWVDKSTGAEYHLNDDRTALIERIYAAEGGPEDTSERTYWHSIRKDTNATKEFVAQAGKTVISINSDGITVGESENPSVSLTPDGPQTFNTETDFNGATNFSGTATFTNPINGSLAVKNNVQWGEDEGLNLYRYEHISTSDYNVPTTPCFVLCFKCGSRGYAEAFSWAHGYEYQRWYCNLHNDAYEGWSDWTASLEQGGTVHGNLTTTGSITANSHSSAIGTVVFQNSSPGRKSSYVSVSAGANTKMSSITLDAGVWIIWGGVHIVPGSAGRFMLSLNTGTGASVGTNTTNTAYYSATNHRMQTMGIQILSASTTYNMNMYSDNAYKYEYNDLYAVRIA